MTRVNLNPSTIDNSCIPNKIYARRTRIFFSVQECDQATVLVYINITLLQRK